MAWICPGVCGVHAETPFKISCLEIPSDPDCKMTRFKHPPIDSNVPLRKDGTKVTFGFGGEDDDDVFTKTSILSLNIFVASRNDVGGVEDDTRVLFDSGGDDDDDDEFTKPSILSSEVSRNDVGGVLFEDDMNLIVDMCLR